MTIHLKLDFFTKYYMALTTLEKRPFENMVVKGEYAGYQHVLLSPKYFSILSKTSPVISVTLTLYHTFPAFNYRNKECFGKKLWEKEKMLVTSISYSIREKSSF